MGGRLRPTGPNGCWNPPMTGSGRVLNPRSSSAGRTYSDAEAASSRHGDTTRRMQKLQQWRNNITCTICRGVHPTAHCPLLASWQATEEMFKGDEGPITVLREKEEWERLESATEPRTQKNGTERMTDLLLLETPTTVKEQQQEVEEQEMTTGARQMDEGLELRESQEEIPSQDQIALIGMTQQIQEIMSSEQTQQQQ